jgi:C-terminal binding-module, SLH-like, of glucodextranase
MRGFLRFLTMVALLAAVYAVLGLALPAVAAEGQPIFTLSDPTGDDYGDGTLMYPMRADMQPGDLDLVRFTATAQAGGTLFEATFARNVRVPPRRTIDQVGTTLDKIAKLGFYEFNIDVYIDTDRIPGSGSTQTLPGRRAAIAPANAWEKAICLTPRPYDAQDMLKAIYVHEGKMELKRRKGSVTSAEVDTISAGVTRDIAASVFFPTVVSVTGRSIRFFVPDAFLGGPARDTWSYVVGITGANVELKVDIPALVGSEGSSPGLMIIPILPGKGFDNFGTNREGDDMQPDLIDIIVPPGMAQEAVLKDYDLMGGRPVALPGVVPADVKVK